MIMTKKTNKEKVVRPTINYVMVYCTMCTSNFKAFKKNNIGELIEQQLCPHTIYKEVKFNA